MNYFDLRSKVKTPVFFGYQVAKIFNGEPKEYINLQLSRMVARGRLVRLKRGLFSFPDFPHNGLNEFDIAKLLYNPAYISLESALNYWGLIPDIPSAVTSITTITSKTFKSEIGLFSYSKVKPDLFFGFMSVGDKVSGLSYNIAEPEKALLDYIYIRKVRHIEELRLDSDLISKESLKNYSKFFPPRVQKVVKGLYE